MRFGYRSPSPQQPGNARHVVFATPESGLRRYPCLHEIATIVPARRSASSGPTAAPAPTGRAKISRGSGQFGGPFQRRSVARRALAAARSVGSSITNRARAPRRRPAGAAASGSRSTRRSRNDGGVAPPETKAALSAEGSSGRCQHGSAATSRPPGKKHSGAAYPVPGGCGSAARLIVTR